MCGISGIIAKSKLDVHEIAKMNAIINHRGPDDEGFVLFNETNFMVAGGDDTAAESWDAEADYCPKQQVNSFIGEDINVAFGHRRLSILDLSPKGHQPMCSANTRYWITYNGEIYNYAEIKEQLIGLGYSFVSHTDTEVILAAFETWGKECLNKFTGMWAFAIYDREERSIFLSRDRYGIKPLYYWFSPSGDFYFASEIKQFTVLTGWRAVLNKTRALDFLYSTSCDHTDETLFKGVNTVLPGHCFSLNVDALKPNANGKIDLIKWYNPLHKPFKGSYNEAKEIFLDHFKKSVELHLISDVQVGSALSGGLDSSSIVSYIKILLDKRNKKEQQKTFSACSHYKKFDERYWMDLVVKDAQVDAHFIYTKGEDVIKEAEKMVWQIDEPYGSQAVFLSNKVFQSAKENDVLVLLNGLGADEYLSGYGVFRLFRYRKLFMSFKFYKLYKECRSFKLIFFVLLEYMLLYLPKVVSKWYGDFSRKNLVYKGVYRLLDNSFRKTKYIGPHLASDYKRHNIIDIAEYHLFKEPLQKYLKYEDRNSMAHSVEARVPFLEHRLVEFASSLPVDYLDSPDDSKRILVDAMKGILTDIVRNRKDKKGFITPESRWFKDDFFDEFLSLFKENVVYAKGIINEERALEYFHAVKSGKVKFTYTYWRVISFCIWMKVYKVNLT